MADFKSGLPPGWDCKWDERAGQYYFINHHSKMTTWEDPRMKYRGTPKRAAEYIPLQHNSPEVRRNYVYPSQSPPIQAFQMNAKSIPLQDLKAPTRSPLTLRGAKVQDSTFTTETEDAVAKISAMFPTVSETHIKLLLKKYMKSIFPNADETVILECLQNNENSIQKTSDTLREMGYSKKDTVKPPETPKPESKTEGTTSKVAVEAAKATPSPAPKRASSEDKQTMKKKLQEQYADVPEHLISIALESVNFNEDRARQILTIMKQEDVASAQQKPPKEAPAAASPPPAPLLLPVSQSRQSIKSLLKTEKKDELDGFKRVLGVERGAYRSANIGDTLGHDAKLCKGPNEKLLLENYIQWQGSNGALQKGPQGFAKGPNKGLLCQKAYAPCGPNADLRKGPGGRFGENLVK
ncbi:BAG family molecular chaperone regulator 3 isoform X4 [Anthonomus grandis grandis]|uniref:BAG family molecular chaperone regulator 3 isoform X4 n=1 Tax=Anthonomus grandis grandis TaxID=2921223 RepID=UPI0021663308|nr:BAG family molecular chaperone regulator 3 isoform X4 [Anthonomus grandis grandis]